MCGAAAACSGSAAAIRCWGGASPTRTESKGRRARSRALGLLDVETALTGEKTLRQRRGRVRRQRRALRRLRDACRQNERPRLRPAAVCASPTGGPTARSRRTGASWAPMCMGSSPTTASAPPGSPSLGAASEIAYEATVERRSIGSPTISTAHLDVEAPAHRSRDKCDATRRRAQGPSDNAGEAVEARQRTPDVGGGRLAPARAHKGVVDQRRPIDPRSRELQAERAGHRRFRPAGVGRAVFRASRRTARAASRGEAPRVRRGGEDEPQRGEARGGQVDEIVEPRRRPAEGGVALVLVADHAVGGVDRLVERPAGRGRRARSRRSARPRRRRNSPRDSRSRRARRPLVEHVRVASDDHRDRAPSLVEAFVEPVGDRAHMGMQAALRREARGETARGPRSRTRPTARGGASLPARRARPAQDRASSASAPSARRAPKPSPGRLSRSSSQASQAPIQVTGWPNSAIERRRIADQRLEPEGGEARATATAKGT